MPLDFSKLPRPQHEESIIDPIEIFQSFRGGKLRINDLWLGQGDALREWEQNRNCRDITITLNTGAGKTLVGLLIAQSLANETKGSVLIACTSIQLVKQTEQHAQEIGLPITTYVQGHFSNNLYQRREAPCVTTYQAIFNGLSRFREDDVKAIIFDDSHTAGNSLRSYFSLSITREDLPSTYDSIVALFRQYFVSVNLITSYEEILTGSSNQTRFVPPFAVRSCQNSLRTLLLEAHLDQLRSTKFSWPHLRDRIDLCAVFVSSNEITITPPFVPVNSLPYFSNQVRRIYLSATTGASDEFERTFGRSPEVSIHPKTTAGECERMILFPSQMRTDASKTTGIEVAKKAIAGHKSLVIVPTSFHAARWNDVSTTYEGEFHERLGAFRNGTDPSCFVVLARFDGIDLPGDSCRLLIIDGLPAGMSIPERFMWEQLNSQKVLRSTIASRFVQSLGRISRGMSDYGVVLITDIRLVEWLDSPKNRSLLPPFVQKQLSIADTISQESHAEDISELVDQCLARDKNWLAYYEDAMSSQTATPLNELNEQTPGLDLAKAESKFRKHFWNREYAQAATALERRIEATLEFSTSIGAWYLLWIGYCYELDGNQEAAHRLYNRSHKAHREIPPIPTITSNADGHVSEQAKKVSDQLIQGIQGNLSLPQNFDTELDALSGNQSTPKMERALELLGTYLGFYSERPDNEIGTGPDVLWITPDGESLCIELKAEKKDNSVYTKDDLGQLRDHQTWVRNSRDTTNVIPLFVGPILPSSPQSNPDDNMMIVELSQFRSIRDSLRDALADICNTATPSTVVSVTHESMSQKKLNWPHIFHAIKKTALKDID